MPTGEASVVGPRTCKEFYGRTQCGSFEELAATHKAERGLGVLATTTTSWSLCLPAQPHACKDPWAAKMHTMEC